jgi:phage baseplate assembly protein W
MSTLEKNLYKRVIVDVPQSQQKPSSSATYRSISSVSNENIGNKLYDLAVIKQDIINHFHIRQGEKLEQPEFGTIIWDVLFDPLTENLKAAIVENVEDIINYDPRVQADQVIVEEYESGLQIECVLVYLNYSIAETMRLQFDQDNGLLS